MTFLLSFGLLFGTNNAVADSSMRCSLIGAEATQQWLAKERARPEPELIPLIERVRTSAWVPTVSLATDFSIDDDERLTLAETARSSDYRSSAITSGGRVFGVELALKWNLGQRFASVLELGVRRHQRQLKLDRAKDSFELLETFKDWLLAVSKFCVCKPSDRPVLYAALIGLEMRLDHFSDGRFSVWLKEQK